MRILLHDNSGHPFPLQLARFLSHQGAEVLHLYSAGFLTPRGGIERKPDDPATMEIRGLDLGEPFRKYDYFRRRLQERRYSKLLGNEIRLFRPDAIIMCNTPIDVQLPAQRIARSLDIPYLFWVQDIYSVAMEGILRRKMGLVGVIISRYYARQEKKLLRNSAHVVAISPGFLPILQSWGVAKENCTVIPNWAPLEEIPLRPKHNSWSERQGLADKFCFVYSGTLGLKHNPNLLLELALQLRERPDVVVVVNSEGVGADWLKERINHHRLDNLRILGFQPYEELPEVLGAADVCVALLEPDAGVYSVPSKILAYLCAGRPLLLAVPPENLAARIVRENEAGIVVNPDSEEAFIEGALNLLNDPQIRENYGKNARAYAEDTFDIDKIGTAFQQIISKIAAPSNHP